MSTWATATTAKDRPEVVQAFVAHHLEAGAAEVWVFLDDPADPVHDLVAGTPGLRLVRCDAAHWAALGRERPASHRQRQWRNANYAKAHSGADWIGHIDIDEFVHADLAFDRLLGALPDEIEVLRLRPVERIFTDLPLPGGISFESRFKRPFPPGGRLDAAIFGAPGASLRRGFLGHLEGKCFARTALRGRQFRLHDVLGPDRAPIAAFDGQTAARLLHYYPFGFGHWIEKFRRRLDDPGYMARLGPRDQAKFRLLEAAWAAGGEAGARRLFADLCLFDPARLARLDGAGCLVDLALDLPAAAARVFGQAAVRVA